MVPSPDGEWVAWVTFPEGALWRSRPDGSERLQLTGNRELAYAPAWSPEGQRIAFVGRIPPAAGLSLRVVPADGGVVETLKEAAPGSGYWDPCWLPDGQSLVFSDGNRGRLGLYRVDVETRAVALFEGGDQLLYPKCGPQGQILASRLDSDGLGWSFVVYRPERDSWERIGPETLGFPTWRTDGQSFCGLSLDATRIQCYSLQTDRLETLVELGEKRLLVDVPDFPWMGLDADDNPLVIFDRGTRDFYALDWEAP